MTTTPEFRPHVGPIGPSIPVDGVFHGSVDLKTLNENGFINIQGPPLVLNRRLQSHADGRIARLNTGASHLYEMMPIHPCLVRDKWDVMDAGQTAYDKNIDNKVHDDTCYRDITNEEWAAVEPAMREASMFLDDPMHLEWFGGILLGKWTDLPSKAGKKDLGKIYQFDTLSEEYKRQHPLWATEIWKLLATELPYMIRWSFGPSDFHGCTYATGRDGWSGNTSESTIVLNEDYMRGLTGEINATDYPNTLSQVDPNDPNKLPSYDVHSARVRTIHGLTTTILHELQHAIVHACFVNFSKHKIREPFFRDQRIAETGYAFEQAVFRGVLDPIGSADIVGVAAHPWGSEFDVFPGMRKGYEDKARGSMARWGVTGQMIYALHMEQICRFLDQRFWDEPVKRWGLDAVWYEQVPGFRVFLRPRVGHNLRWPGESPTIMFSTP